VEALFSIQGHPTTEAFEEYAFKRLSEADTEKLEEHLLVCEECQTSLAEVDEYILLMKQATAQYEPAPKSRSDSPRMGDLFAASLLRKGPRRSLTYAVGLIAVTASVFLMMGSRPLGWASHSETEAASASVELLALRGGAPGTNQAQSGRPLDLKIDLTGVEDGTGAGSAGVISDSTTSEAKQYRIEVVDAVGKLVWSGEAVGVEGSLSAHLPKSLTPGQYWVRLYSRGALLREFGLGAD
jgi:hypothetical protein